MFLKLTEEDIKELVPVVGIRHKIRDFLGDFKYSTFIQGSTRVSSKIYTKRIV